MISNIFPMIYGIILPIDELHHFSRWAHCTTNQIKTLLPYRSVAMSVLLNYRRVTWPIPIWIWRVYPVTRTPIFFTKSHGQVPAKAPGDRPLCSPSRVPWAKVKSLAGWGPRSHWWNVISPVLGSYEKGNLADPHIWYIYIYLYIYILCIWITMWFLNTTLITRMNSCWSRLHGNRLLEWETKDRGFQISLCSGFQMRETL